jgi:LmbE family N-acetylglucosaminyl deacetylase
MSAQLMHIVAHQDDDLLFMNPDLASAIQSGAPTVTIFLTAGQKSGLGATDGQRARSRQRGIQDAYARMAGHTPLGDQSEWTGALFPIATRQLERYTLTGTGVQLVFVALQDGQLSSLYAGTPHLTVVTTGGLGAPQYGYNRADVVTLLSALMTHYQPAQVRALDPLPEARYWPVEHPDHVTAAQFVADVAWPGPVVNYRGYSIGAIPVNLAPDAVAGKSAAFSTYQAYDDDAAASGWTERMYYRWPRGGSWVGRNADGTLQVFTVRAGTVWTWWQVGGGWSPAKQLGGAGGPLAPTLAIAYDTDGRMELLGRRLSDHRIVVVWQTTPSGTWFPSWLDLGNHNAGHPLAGQLGTPATARHADGRLCLFVKNAGGGVSMKSQTAAGSGWGGWVDLGGTDVQDGLSAVADPAGRIHLFAATRGSVLHWFQASPNAAFTANPGLPSLVPASPPTAVLGPDGRIRVLYRRAGGTEVAVGVQGAAPGTWLTPVTGPAPGGTGQLSATVFDGQLRIFARDRHDGVSVGLLDGGNVPGGWDELGGKADCPVAATEPGGSLRVFAAENEQVSYRSWPDEGAWNVLT